ncbi:MAG: alpha/beta hydrolase domain-containing protein [Acidobacteriota bacterium]
MLCRIFALSAALFSLVAHAAVTRVEVTERADLPVAGFERITGKLHFAEDPKLAANKAIVDLALAPKNAQGLVEFTSDFQVFRAKDIGKSNGTALLEIVNRGRSLMWTSFNTGANANMRLMPDFGDNFLLAQGFTLVWVGWQFDAPKDAGSFKLYAPMIANITGPVRIEVLPNSKQTFDTLPYPLADASSGTLTRRDSPYGPRSVIPRTQWQYSADSKRIEYASGFEPGRIYEFVYTAKEPVVAGLGMAAVRDYISHIKHHGTEPTAAGSSNEIKRAMAYGFSQSGRLLRTFLYEGFNADEQGKQVFEGVWANGAGAGHGGFNQRFVQPGRTTGEYSGSYYPTDQPPFTPAGILSKAVLANVAPKLILSNGSHEYWGRAAALNHISEDGLHDVEPPANVRLYSIASIQHGGGSGAANALVANPTNSLDVTLVNRALILALNAWITSNTPPPASLYPRIDKGELVPVSSIRYPYIPGLAMVSEVYAVRHLDFGPDYLTKGIVAYEPPRAGAAYPVLVPQVDVDGNEVTGIRLPELRTPLATYLGWNLRNASVGSPHQQYALMGSMARLALDRGDREKSGDSRLSITERYRGGRQDYLTRIEADAKELVKRRFLLVTDVQRALTLAGRHWDQIAGAITK